ncbi:MAG: hypothetical protein ACE5DZ_08510 [Mariprofundus sp.]
MEQQHTANSAHDPEAAMDIVHQKWAPAWLRGAMAFAVGGAVMQTGFQVLDVHLEWFSGIASFNVAWVLAMTVLPVGTGILIGVIYGYGGKYLAHFPPAAVLIISYYQSMQMSEPAGMHLLPIGLMTVFIILQMEFCAVGGFLGELLMRRRSGWTSQYAKSSDSERLPDERDS